MHAPDVPLPFIGPGADSNGTSGAKMRLQPTYVLGLTLLAAPMTGCRTEAAPLTAATVGGVQAEEDAGDIDPEAAIEPMAFDDMNHEQQMRYMKETVMPTMAPLFASFDEKEFAKFTCATCHGSDAKERDFHMPNPELPQLDPSDNFRHWRQKDPQAVEFMAQEVVPNMASLLSEPVYNPASGEGFGCMDCHTQK